MSTVNQGSQTLVYDFRYPAKGRDFNKISRDIQRPGIYKGLTISYSGNNVFISAGKGYLNCLYNGLDNLGIKIDFDSIFTYGTVLPSAFGQNEILYIEYEYAQVDENYAEYKRQALSTWLASPNPNAIILGELTFDGSNNITGVDYGRKTWGSINADADWTIPDRLVYHDTDTPTKRWRLDGGLLPAGTRDLQFQNFTEDSARILITSPTDETEIECTTDSTSTTTGALVIAGGLGIVKRLNVGQLDGRVPMQGVIGVAPVFTLTANGGTASEPGDIPASGVISDDGFQRADGVVIPSGAKASLVGKFTCDISDNRFLMGSTGITSSPISTDTGVNNGDNSVTLTLNEIPSHDHDFNDPGHAHGIPSASTDAGSGGFVSGTADEADGGTRSADTNITFNAQGGGASFDIRPKWIKVIYLQRVR